jgi:hypothetical protein
MKSDGVCDHETCNSIRAFLRKFDKTLRDNPELRDALVRVSKAHGAPDDMTPQDHCVAGFRIVNTWVVLVENQNALHENSGETLDMFFEANPN